MIEVTFTYSDNSRYVVRRDRKQDYVAGETAIKLELLLDGVIKNGHPEMGIFERASFIAVNSRMCKKCGCSENNPCIAPDPYGTCSWVAEDLCSHCQSGLKVLHPYETFKP